MADIISLIGDLEKRIDAVIEVNQELKQRNEALHSEKNALQKAISDQENILSSLTEKNKMLKLAKSLNDSDEQSTDIKLKINELVRELDKCIALLTGN